MDDDLEGMEWTKIAGIDGLVVLEEESPFRLPRSIW